MYNQEYLESLIKNKTEENLNLDYKASDSLKRNDKSTSEISKDVSAFANSDGGIIIYGINEDPKNRHLPHEIDAVDRRLISKEWLEQIIQSKIRPRIEGIQIYPIEINSETNKVVYVIEIPKSTTAHQADDKRYYKRFNFNSEPMHDYEIKDIINRKKTPIIDLEFQITKFVKEIKSETPKFLDYSFKAPSNEYRTNYYLKVFARNNGKVYAQYINCYVSIPMHCLKLDGENSIEYYFADNKVRDVLGSEFFGTRPQPKYGPSRYEPILPTLRMKLDFNFPKLNDTCLETEIEISYVVYADNSEPRPGKIKFRDIKIIEE
jgi:hypothetical protein